ncbi:MAG: hypothetical protein DMG32_22345 [Acidobacteria bacterium]|nr:MAG: hypothetical protein DMG32_22345 [Acidobacteriota bacterium]
MHTIASYFVYRLCWELLENAIAASCAALFFAIHPIHIESVCWISASNEILYTIFFLSSVLIFAHGIRTPPPQRLWLSVGLWSAALFSKETAIALLPIFPLLGFSRGHWDGWRARLRVALHMGTPYLVPAVIYLAVRWLVLRGVGVEIGKHSWQQVFCSSPSLLLFYFKKLAWPVRLSGFYLNPLVSRPSSEMWLTLLPILAGVVLLAWLAVRYSRCIGLAGCLILLPLIPALAATRVYDQGNMAHDRYLYLPSVGFSLLFGLSATKLWSGSLARKALLTAFASALLVACVYLTITQQRFYRTDESFYSRAIEIAPENVLVIDYLGNTFLRQGQHERALEELTRAHQLAPGDANATFFLARGLFEDRQYAAAKPYLEDLSGSGSISTRRRRLILLSLAIAEFRLGDTDRAEHTLWQLEALDPQYRGLHRTLAIIYHYKGDILEAQKQYAREFQVSGDLEARNKAIELARFLRSSRKGLTLPF